MERRGRLKNPGLWPRLLGLAIVPLAVQAVLPAVGGVLSILTPLPLAYGMARRGIPEGTAAVALVAVLTGLIGGLPQGLLFFLETVPLCIGIRLTVFTRAPLYRSVILATGLVVLTALASLLVYSLYSGLGPGEIYGAVIQRMGLFMDGFSDTSRLGPEETRILQWLMDLWRKLFLGIWVSTVIFLVTFYALLIRGWMVAGGFIRAEGLSSLSDWMLPFPFVPAFILVASVVLLAEGGARDVALNFLLPVGSLYGIQGIIVAGHMFARWKLPPFFRALFPAFGIIFFPFVFMITVALVGLFDTWIEFRRRWPVTGEPPSASSP